MLELLKIINNYMQSC